MLIIFGGLPGTGKTTIARALAKQLEAVYLRIDSIEQAIRTSAFRPAGADIGPEGYFVACELAADNLRMGRTVVTDSVNPDLLTRKAYRAVAEAEKVSLLEIEVICSDKTEHQKRIETRKSDIPGLVLPTWQSVVAREYENWDRPHLLLDTSSSTTQECVQEILRSLPSRASD
jgi:predicted kinase